MGCHPQRHGCQRRCATSPPACGSARWQVAPGEACPAPAVHHDMGENRPGSRHATFPAPMHVHATPAGSLVGRVLLTSTFVAYAGAFNAPARELLLEEHWRPALLAAGIILDPGFHPMDLLSSSNTKAWQWEGGVSAAAAASKQLFRECGAHSVHTRTYTLTRALDHKQFLPHTLTANPNPPAADGMDEERTAQRRAVVRKRRCRRALYEMAAACGPSQAGRARGCTE